MTAHLQTSAGHRSSLDFARSGSATTSLATVCIEARSPTTLLLRRNSSAASAAPWPGAPGPMVAAALPVDDARHLATAAANGSAWHSRPSVLQQQQPCAGYLRVAAGTSFAANVPATGSAPLTAPPQAPRQSPFAEPVVQTLLLASGESSDSEEYAFGLPKRAAQWPMHRPLRRSSAGPAALDKMRNAARSRLLGNLRNRSGSNLRRRVSLVGELAVVRGPASSSGGLAPAAAGLDVLQNLDVCAAVEQFRAAVA